jgi:hypothetical protein
VIEAQYKTRDGHLILKVQGETPKDLFRQLSMVQDIFEAGDSCGCCNSKNIRFRVRTHEGMDFYELLCQDCAAQFSFGQHKTGGTLFPKRRNDAGEELPNRGWHRYDGFKSARG